MNQISTEADDRPRGSDSSEFDKPEIPSTNFYAVHVRVKKRTIGEAKTLGTIRLLPVGLNHAHACDSFLQR